MDAIGGILPEGLVFEVMHFRVLRIALWTIIASTISKRSDKRLLFCVDGDNGDLGACAAITL